MKTNLTIFAGLLLTISASNAPTTADIRASADRSASAIDATLNGTDGTLPPDVRVPSSRPPTTVN
ncbi:MAG: hypothetical protein AAGH82_11245 [Pseudomonadota bacterium]